MLALYKRMFIITAAIQINEKYHDIYLMSTLRSETFGSLYVG